MINAPAQTSNPEQSAMPHRLVLRPASAVAEAINPFTFVASAEVVALCRDASANAAPQRPAAIGAERRAAYGYD